MGSQSTPGRLTFFVCTLVLLGLGTVCGGQSPLREPALACLVVTRVGKVQAFPEIAAGQASLLRTFGAATFYFQSSPGPSRSPGPKALEPAAWRTGHQAEILLELLSAILLA